MLPCQRRRILSFQTAEKYVKEKQGFVDKVSVKGLPLQRHSSFKTESCHGSKGVLGSHSPQSLIETLWFLLTQHFGIRDCQEHHEMYVDDFAVSTDDNGTEFMTYQEYPTKTRQGGLRNKRKVVKPKIFARGGQRCPGNCSKHFWNEDPNKCETVVHFILPWMSDPRPKCGKSGTSDKRWASKALIPLWRIWQVRQNTRQKSCKLQCSQNLGKEAESLKPTADSDIGTTEHTNERSLAYYEEGAENEQRTISSSIISAERATAQTSRISKLLERLDAAVNTSVANTFLANDAVNHLRGRQFL